MSLFNYNKRMCKWANWKERKENKLALEKREISQLF